MTLARRLATRSVLMLAIRLGGAGMMFALQAAMARLWGPAPLGQFLLVVAAINLSAMVMPLGFQSVGSYFAAEYQAAGQGRSLRRFVSRTYVQIALAGAVLALAFYPLTALPGETGATLRAVWLPFVAMAAATAVVFANGGVLVGLKRPLAGFIVDGLARPMVMLAGFAVALAATTPAERLGTIMWVAAGLYGLAAVAHSLYLARALHSLPAGDAMPDQTARWWRYAVPWSVIAIATDFFFDLDLLHLSALMTAHDLAVFGVAARLFGLLAFAVNAVYLVGLPHLFDSAGNNDLAGVARRIGDANVAATGLALCILLGSAAFGPVIPLVFGVDFAEAGSVLTILSLSLVVRAALGPAAVVLSISDRPNASLPSIALGVLVLVAGNCVLVPAWGVVGAAAAAVVAIAAWSLAMWLTALRLTGQDVSILPRIKDVLARRAVA